MKVRKIKAMRDRQLRRHLADWWESTVTVRHYLHLLAAVRARQKARALGVGVTAERRAEILSRLPEPEDERD